LAGSMNLDGHVVPLGEIVGVYVTSSSKPSLVVEAGGSEWVSPPLDESTERLERVAVILRTVLEDHRARP
jgi:hypothetical protein